DMAVDHGVCGLLEEAAHGGCYLSCGCRGNVKQSGGFCKGLILSLWLLSVGIVVLYPQLGPILLCAVATALVVARFITI
ncbi:MAG: hypothetical protein Q4A74_06355, partial [Cardiobacteriaceae bacterium]|nr:hypothetical protein [Cardiobacteriaceae bacterium]